MAAINSFCGMRCGDLNLLNKANIVLVPKEGQKAYLTTTSLASSTR
jgi:hypothetical protein